MSRRTAVVAATAVAVIAVLTGCGRSSSSESSAASTMQSSTSSPSPSGSVSVLHAGSLVNLIDKTVGPAFATATGNRFSGYGADSQSVANAIKGKTQTGDVFISASPTVNASLEGTTNGDWVSWFASFATAPLVIAYNPKSSYAKDFVTKPWYQVLTEPGIRLGRTDPVLDPKGKLTVAALQAAVTTYDQPSSFPSTVEKKAAVFPEQVLQGRLQSGQIDAGFFYTNESVPLRLKTVTLGQVHEAATFTITVLNRAKNAAGGAAFVNYLLTTAKPTLNANGLETLTPVVSGDKSEIPASLRTDLGL
jgi:molybdate/tungstate transport system substrate-binding protein